MLKFFLFDCLQAHASLRLFTSAMSNTSVVNFCPWPRLEEVVPERAWKHLEAHRLAKAALNAEYRAILQEHRVVRPTSYYVSLSCVKCLSRFASQFPTPAMPAKASGISNPSVSVSYADHQLIAKDFRPAKQATVTPAASAG